MYTKENTIVCDSSSHINSSRSLLTNRSNTLDTLNVSEALNTECTNIQNICMPGTRHNKKCPAQSSKRSVYGYISCPYMFKCHGDFCISISVVCDNKFDFINGEDEHFAIDTMQRHLSSKELKTN